MEKQKKISLLIPLFLLFPFLGDAEIVTNTLQLRTNLLCICVVTNVTAEDSAATNSQTYSIYEPVFTDKDFISWSLKDNTFAVTPQAAKRFMEIPSVCDRQFVVVCSGKPVCSGGAICGGKVTYPIISTSSVSDPIFLYWELNSDTNAVFTIDRIFPDSGGRDVGLNDPRLILAVEKLFGKKQPLVDFTKPDDPLEHPFWYNAFLHQR